MSVESMGGLFKRLVDPARCVRVPCDPSTLVAPDQLPAKGVLLSRGLLLHRWADLKNVPRGKRSAVVASQLKAWSPFANSGFRVVMSNSSAALFAWDQERLLNRLANERLSPNVERAVLPESWLVPAPFQADAVRLMQGFDGYEGQVWQHGELRASRFWAALPDELEWLNFLRGASVTPALLLDRDAALVERPQWNPAGWGRLLRPTELLASGTRWERLILWWGSLTLIAATAMVAKGAWQQAQTTERAQVRLAELRESTAPVIKLRESALDNLGRIANILELLKRPDPLIVLAHLTDRLANQPGVLLREMELNGLALRLSISVPANAQRAALVQSLESGAWLVDVAEVSGTGGSTTELLLTMRLNGPFPPAEVKSDESVPRTTGR